ncbi:MAG: PAS domain-containing protein [Myxococcales bacterium]|nr:PAS domain-containing protein [Myxococcales bacterium]MCB9522697.1 PAS domain-containing protein [Myxococcales bacterium]
MADQDTLVDAPALLEPGLLEAVIDRWRATFDSIPDPIVLIDQDFAVRRANQAAVGEGDVREALGSPCHHLLFGLDAPCEGCPAVNLAAGSTADADVIPPGDGRTWSVHVAPLHPRGDESDAASWRVCQHRDVTEARRLQREVLLLEKLAAVGELASHLAHELNNPLTSIITFAQLMGRGRTPPEQVTELAGDIEVQAQRCSRLVRSLLQFGRPGHEPEVGRLNFGPLIQECLDVFRTQYAHQSDLAFATEGLDDPSLPPLSGVADALRSLVINLIQNAILSMGKAGRITLALRPVDDGHALELAVTDTGPGVAPELRDRIFEPFYSTRPLGKGTGLGLAIVHNVVRDHGGRVWVTDGPQGGACFRVRLPAAHAAEITDRP